MAQNLVPNHSFELYFQCPISSYNISDVKKWSSPSLASPDYFNACFNDTLARTKVGVPSNSFGFQNAKTGNAYAGFLAYNAPNTSSTHPENHEYIQIRLKETLKVGKKYCVSFYVSLSEHSAYAIQELGLHFVSDSTFIELRAPLPLTAHIEYNKGLITDKKKWTRIVATYVAKGNEKYIIIGNFNSFSNTTVKTLSSDPLQTGVSYYYIDDVWVNEFIDNCAPVNCNFNLGNDTLLCPLDTLILQVDEVKPPYKWQDGSIGSTFTVTKPGTYWLRLPHCEMSDTIEISYRSYDKLNLGNDTILCEGDSLLLNNTDSCFNLLRWQDNSTDSSFLATKSGRYWIEVEQKNDKCIVRDSLSAFFLSPQLKWSKKLEYCSEDEPKGALIKLNDTLRTYSWSNGVVGNTVRIRDTGIHNVLVSVNGVENCSVIDTFQITSYCEPRFYVPNSFSPNSDLINDKFKIIGSLDRLFNFEIQIFDRWGKLVYFSNNPKFEWSGTAQGNNLNTSSFTWKIRYHLKNKKNQLETNTMFGKVLLIR